VGRHGEKKRETFAAFHAGNRVKICAVLFNDCDYDYLGKKNMVEVKK
jgi:hypothetical protein